MGRYAFAVQHAFRTMTYMPLAFITAQTGKNVKALLNMSQSMFKQAQKRVGTGTLTASSARPSTPTRPRCARAAPRGSTTPPRSAPRRRPSSCSSTHTSLFDATYQRYLLNVFREKLPFHDIPIKLYLRARTQTDPNAPSSSSDDPTADVGSAAPGSRRRRTASRERIARSTARSTNCSRATIEDD